MESTRHAAPCAQLSSVHASTATGTLRRVGSRAERKAGSKPNDQCDHAALPSPRTTTISGSKHLHHAREHAGERVPRLAEDGLRALIAVVRRPLQLGDVAAARR